MFGGKANGYRNDLHSYDIQTNTWTKIETIKSPTPRYGHTAVAYSGIMYLFGGYDNMAFCSNELCRFDLTTQAWLEPIRFAQIEERFHHSVCLNENIMYVSGGRDNGKKVFNSIYAINLDTLECTTLPPFPQARFGHVSYFNETIHLFGGCNHEKDFNLLGIEYTTDWTTVQNNGVSPLSNGCVFATVTPNGDLFYGGVTKNVVQQEASTFVELSEDLGEAIISILQFLPLHDLLSIIFASKNWHVSQLAKRKK